MRKHKKKFLRWTIGITILFLVGIFVLRKTKRPSSSFSESDLPHGEVKRSKTKPASRYKDYFNKEHLRQGPGEFGKPVKLSRREAFGMNDLIKTVGFNVRASDKIAVDRALPDARNDQCKAKIYPKDLPTASVIIIFINEAWSTLLRTVHSVVNRSPPELLHEVILVDDFSDKEYLKSKLDEYVSETWPEGVVRLVRNKERSGLIRSKVFGAKEARGDVLVFLDAHCEASKGWLEPLLMRIKEDRTRVVCPHMFLIDSFSLEFPSWQPLINVGGFNWNLHFTWLPVPKTFNPDERNPVRSPTMAGGLFAMERKYFFEIGAYDMGMDVWGGENLEMSFRVWMCGGSLEVHPCSIVGHIFKRHHPYTSPGNKDTHGINSLRLAEVWMDDYKRFFYMQRQDLLNVDYGDVSDRKQLRRHHRCHDFKWFLNNVYPEKFIPDENVQAYGTLQVKDTRLCLDTFGIDVDRIYALRVFWCQEGRMVSKNQFFSLTHENTVRHQDLCLHIALPAYSNFHVQGRICEDTHNMKWIHDKINGTIMNQASGYCLDAFQAKSGDNVLIQKCDGSPTQRWAFLHYME